MKRWLLILPLLGGCETLQTPVYDESGSPVMTEGQEFTVPTGEGTVTYTAPPRESTVGDQVATVGASVIAGAAGMPLLAGPIGAILGGLFRRKRKKS